VEASRNKNKGDSMAILGTLVSDFKNSALAVKNFIIKVAGEAPKAVADVAADEAKIAPVIEAFIPGSASAIALFDTIGNTVAQAVEDAGTAAGSNGLSVSFDQSVVNDVKAVIAAAKAAAAKV
jgi:isopropylmalate/homocitrate/citramalate synthase